MLGAVLKPFTLASALAASAAALLVRRSRRARLVYHLTLYSGTLGLMSVWGVVVTVGATLLGQRYNINYVVARSFYHLASPLVGIRIKVEGRHHLTGLLTAREGKPQSAVLIGNHQSFLDILYLGRILPKQSSILAKRELMYMPLLGQFMAASGAVFVNRKDRHNAIVAMSKAGATMKRRGISLWIFPEGTRTSSATPGLLPFKKGAFHLAVEAQVPIVPVVCENYHHLFDGRTRMERGELRLRVLPPISTAGLTSADVAELAESTRETMIRTLVEISRPGPGLARASIEEKVDQGLADDMRSLETRKSNEGVGAGAEGDAGSGMSSGVDVGSPATSTTGTGEVTETEDEMDEDAVLMKRPKGTAQVDEQQ